MEVGRDARTCSTREQVSDSDGQTALGRSSTALHLTHYVVVRDLDFPRPADAPFSRTPAELRVTEHHDASLQIAEHRCHRLMGEP